MTDFLPKAWVALCAILLSTQVTFANTWYVNDASQTGDVFTTAIGNDANPGTAAQPFATILFAINAAANGDTIYVDAGSYTTVFEINKPLTLRGAKFGIPAGPAAVPINRGTDESIINGAIYYGQSRDNITVDGFTVNAGTELRGIEARGLNTVIINNIVIGIPTPLVQQAGIATRANGPLRLHSYLVKNNHVTGFRFGIYFDGNLENSSEFSYNYVANCSTTGIVITGSNGHLFRANVVENNFQGISILKGNQTILENTVRGSSFIGIRLVGTATNSGNIILNNFIQNNAAGIGLTDPNPASVNNQAHFNSFTGNTVNIGNTHDATFDATCNWFESTDPVVIAAGISGPVTFAPFLTDGIDSDPGLDGFQPITSCVVPVLLTSFTGQAKDWTAVLNWSTSSEINSSHFVIERSTDQVRFSSIGRVQAQGFSQTSHSYQFTDADILFGQPVFYRLKMVDLDGTYQYSKVIRLTFNKGASFVQRVFPNPAKAGQSIQADITSDSNQWVQVSLLNTAGQRIMQQSFRVQSGQGRYQLNIPSTAKGFMILMIRAEDGTLHTEKMQVN